jgi:phosphohistidine phosphatase
MKRLIIFRHAKTERENPNGDKARELTGRGRRNATEMGLAIAERAGIPDSIVSSDAVRARQTAEIAASSMDFQGDIRLEPEIYLASLDDLIGVVRGLPDAVQSAAIVGHNPAFEELANWFAGESNGIDHLPTAGFVIVDLNVSSWKQADSTVATVVGNEAPSKS